MAGEAVTPSATSEQQAEAMRRGVGVFELVAVSAVVAAKVELNHPIPQLSNFFPALICLSG